MAHTVNLVVNVGETAVCSCIDVLGVLVSHCCRLRDWISTEAGHHLINNRWHLFIQDEIICLAVNMQERDGAFASMAQMELVNGIAADGRKGCNLVAASIRHSVGHHTSIRESAAIDAFAVNLILRGDIFDDSPQKFHIFVLFARGIPASIVGTEDGKVYGLTLRISHNATLRVSNSLSEWAIVCTMATGTVQRNHKRTVVCDITRNIKLIVTGIAADRNLYILVYTLVYVTESKVGGIFICASLCGVVIITIFAYISQRPTLFSNIFDVPDCGISAIKSSAPSKSQSVNKTFVCIGLEIIVFIIAAIYIYATNQVFAICCGIRVIIYFFDFEQIVICSEGCSITVISQCKRARGRSVINRFTCCFVNNCEALSAKLGHTRVLSTWNPICLNRCYTAYEAKKHGKREQ